MEMSAHGLSVHGLLQFLTHAHTHTWKTTNLCGYKDKYDDRVTKKPVSSTRFSPPYLLL